MKFKFLSNYADRAEQERQKQSELEFENSIRVVFSIDHAVNSRILKAIRHDKIEHWSYINASSIWGPTKALYKARKILINEIELITGRPVMIVLNHDDEKSTV